MSEYAPSCALRPGSGGPGWYLVSQASYAVEAGPFSTEAEAHAHAEHLEAESLGVSPWPWHPVRSKVGLLVGSRHRKTREKVNQANG